MSHTLPRCGTDLDSTAVVFGAVLKRLFRRWNLTLGATALRLNQSYRVTQGSRGGNPGLWDGTALRLPDHFQRSHTH